MCVCVWGKKGVSSRQITILNYACLSLVRRCGMVAVAVATGRSGDGDEPRSLIPPGTNLDRKERRCGGVGTTAGAT